MNTIILSGTVLETPKLSHEVVGEKLYKTTLSCRRLSGKVDLLPCIVSEVMVAEFVEQKRIKVSGEVRTCNVHDDEGKSHLSVAVFVKKLHNTDLYDNADQNEVTLNGFACKKPNFRETPSGRLICDAIIASNRMYGKSDFIPCIFWGRNALRAAFMSIGTKVNVEGRLQSRNYRKLVDGVEETRTVIELSAARLWIVKNETED